MDAAVTQLRENGLDVRDEDVARVSPFVRHHINLYGKFDLDMDTRLNLAGVIPIGAEGLTAPVAESVL